jgi:hypothetical protein
VTSDVGKVVEEAIRANPDSEKALIVDIVRLKVPLALPKNALVTPPPPQMQTFETTASETSSLQS